MAAEYIRMEGPALPKLSHGSASAPLTPADVKIPDSLYQFDHGKPGITLFKTLSVLEAMGKDIHQAAPDEFRVVQGDQPFWLSRLPASGGKSNLILRNRKDTSVGDGDSVGIASQIFGGIAKTVEGLLDIRAPVLFVKAVLPLIETGRITQFSTGRSKNKGSAFVKGRKQRHIFALELVAQDFNGDKELSRGPADPAIRCEPAAGDDAVHMHMHMVAQLLVPGMEDLDDARLCAQVFLIRSQFQEGFCTASVEEAVKKVLVAVNERVQFMGEGEDHVEIRRVDNLRPAPVHPDLLKDDLAVGAAAVAAGIIVEIHMPALGALADVISKLSRLAVQDGLSGFLLDIGLEVSLCAVRPVGQFKNFPDLQVSHGGSLPSGQRG